MNLLQFYRELRVLCSQAFSTYPPSHVVINRAVELLLMTIAHESGRFRYVRQTVFDDKFLTWRGGFGVGQHEIGSVTDSLQYLRERPAMADRLGRWLFRHNGVTERWVNYYTPELFQLHAVESPRLSALAARVHYLREREPIPEGEQAMAEYAKVYYNTHAGSATPAKYMKDYRWARAQLANTELAQSILVPGGA